MSDANPVCSALQPPNPAIPIRRVLPEDLLSLAACWPERSAPVLETLIWHADRLYSQGRGLGVVVEHAQQIYAYGMLTQWRRCGEISDLYVQHELRGRGLGTAMIQHLVQFARQELRAPCVEIGVALSNPRALALYRRLGFGESHTVHADVDEGYEAVMYLRLSF